MTVHSPISVIPLLTCISRSSCCRASAVHEVLEAGESLPRGTKMVFSAKAQWTSVEEVAQEGHHRHTPLNVEGVSLRRSQLVEQRACAFSSGRRRGGDARLDDGAGAAWRNVRACRAGQLLMCLAACSIVSACASGLERSSLVVAGGDDLAVNEHGAHGRVAVAGGALRLSQRSISVVGSAARPWLVRARKQTGTRRVRCTHTQMFGRSRTTSGSVCR